MATLTIKTLLYVVFVLVIVENSESYRFGDSLWCYRCVSTQPGCGEDFDWRWHWSVTCPGGKDDKCVKIVERKGADVMITRECLSTLEGYRRDIPADRYEGCRPAAKDVKLSHYTFNEISELDIKRDYFDETKYCFCDFDYFCNGAQLTSSVRWMTATVTTLLAIILRYFCW